MSDLPAPLVSADVDLRGMPFMPLYGDRLFKSATWIGASPEAKVAALRLWWQSYAHEVPAASLPDDDTLLADYAGYGIAVKAWQKIRQQAMRGWVLCSDGRWYHRIVAEFALEAWQGRQRNREKQRRWRAKSGNGDGAITSTITPAVTVTDKVTSQLCNAGEGEGQLQGQLQEVPKVKISAPSGALSGSPPDGTKSGGINGHDADEEPVQVGAVKATRGLVKRARAVLDYLNETAGKGFQPVQANVGPIVARLKEGFTDEQLRIIAFVKTQQWGGDEKMVEYLRPATLYNATKCAQYAGEIPGGNPS